MGRKILAEAQISQIKDNKYHGLKPRLQGLLGVICGFAWDVLQLRPFGSGLSGLGVSRQETRYLKLMGKYSSWNWKAHSLFPFR
jgi:hypothetical protein